MVRLSAWLAFLGLLGCTVAPKIVAPPSSPYFSGNAVNGGLIDLGPPVPKGHVPVGPAHVTAEWVAAYAALAKKYGKDFVPPVHPDDGLTPRPDGTYSVDLEHLEDKNVMATMQRSGISP